MTDHLFVILVFGNEFFSPRKRHLCDIFFNFFGGHSNACIDELECAGFFIENEFDF